MSHLPKFMLPSLLYLLLATQLFGQVSAKVEGPEEAEAGSLVELQVTIQGDDASSELTPQPKELLERYTKDGKLCLIWVAKQGVYKLDLIVVGVVDGKAKLARVKHTITVGNNPGPTPPDPNPPGPNPPDPKPPADPQAKKVYAAALANKLPAAECKKVSENMRAVIAEAVATPITLAEIRQKIKAKNEPVTAGNPDWDNWESVLPTIFTVTNREQAIQAYNKIADGLAAVK